MRDGPAVIVSGVGGSLNPPTETMAKGATPTGSALAVAPVRDTDELAPLAWIVILNYNRPGLTLACVDSVLKLDYPNFHLIVVDNASTDDSVEQFKKAFIDSRIELLVNDRNEGYAGGNNRGIDRAMYEGASYVFILNSDTIVTAGCLEALVAAMEADPRIGIAGCQIEDVGYESTPNQGQQISLFTGITAHWPHCKPALSPTDVDFICGAAILLRAEILHQVGAFDAKFFMYCEDVDIAFRVRRAGYKVCFIPGPGVRHFMSSTAGAAQVRPLVSFYRTRNRAWLIRRHGKLKHRVVFALWAFISLYPKMLLGRIVKGDFHLIWPLLKGMWDGHVKVLRPPVAQLSEATSPRDLVKPTLAG